MSRLAPSAVAIIVPFLLCAACADESTEEGTGGSGISSTAGGGGGGGVTSTTTSTGGSGGQISLPPCGPTTVSGDLCPTVDEHCVPKEGGCCVCQVVDSCGEDPVWVCADPSSNADCGHIPPKSGTMCNMAGLTCDYCQADLPETWQCSGGSWTEVEFGCVGG